MEDKIIELLSHVICIIAVIGLMAIGMYINNSKPAYIYIESKLIGKNNTGLFHNTYRFALEPVDKSKYYTFEDKVDFSTYSKYNVGDIINYRVDYVSYENYIRKN